jgi:hypothetical protein
MLLLCFVAGVVVIGALFVRVRYESLGRGWYIHIEVATPWKR